jgi:hypothetical protein
MPAAPERPIDIHTVDIVDQRCHRFFEQYGAMFRLLHRAA